MFEASITINIAAAHHLRGYHGKCENVHGHNYKVEATIGTKDLDQTGLSLDFGLLREKLWKVAGHLDHTDLNQLPEFSELNPSSENIARVIYRGLAEILADSRVELLSVSVWETEGASVTYHERH
jgi:6-pyruvoyltetrahydropterin/6-carboxytetrahydropterin synthase